MLILYLKFKYKSDFLFEAFFSSSLTTRRRFGAGLLKDEMCLECVILCLVRNMIRVSMLLLILFW